MNKVCFFSVSIAMAFIMQNCQPDITNTQYQGQAVPGNIPELFAPSIVNTDSIEINAVYNSFYTELFFTRIINGSFVIHHSELTDGSWTKPQPIYMYSSRDSNSVAIDPTITVDGNTMYFLGISPKDKASQSLPDIYSSQKIKGKWQLATKVGAPVSTDEYAESYPVVVADGSLYFTSDREGSLGKRDIYRAQYLKEGVFDTPVNIGPAVNTKAGERSTYVAPDESYLITANTYTNEKGFAVSFKEDSNWQRPVPFDLGEPIDTNWIYFCPYMSPDGKYFFFSKRRSDPPKSGWRGVTKGEVYWVDSKNIFDQMKNKEN